VALCVVPVAASGRNSVVVVSAAFVTAPPSAVSEAVCAGSATPLLVAELAACSVPTVTPCFWAARVALCVVPVAASGRNSVVVVSTASSPAALGGAAGAPALRAKQKEPSIPVLRATGPAPWCPTRGSMTQCGSGCSNWSIANTHMPALPGSGKNEYPRHTLEPSSSQAREQLQGTL